MKALISLAIAPLLALASGTATAADSVQYEGIAHDVDGGGELYREQHFVERAEDGSGTRLVLYRCGDGRPFGRKRIAYAAGQVAPDFELVDARAGHREGVRTKGGTREVFVAERGKAEKSAKLDDDGALVADAGFDDFVRKNWDALQGGDSVKIDFLVPSELEALGFKVRKERDETVFGEQASVIRLALGGLFGLVVPPLDVTYSNARRELLRFEGLSNIRAPDGDNLTARIEFDPAARKPLDAAARAAAEAETVVASCD